MTPAEFERVAARLGELEDHLQACMLEAGGGTFYMQFQAALRLAIAAHGQLQLELQHPDIARELPDTGFDWPLQP